MTDDLDALRRGLQSAPAPEADAKARASAERHPVYKAYNNARNYYEDWWTSQNPEQRQAGAEAQMNLPPSERRNMPRKDERRIIQDLKGRIISGAGADMTACAALLPVGVMATGRTNCWRIRARQRKRWPLVTMHWRPPRPSSS